MSETHFCRHLTTKYCVGNGIDIGSGGDPVVPTAVQIELPKERFDAYGHAHEVTVEPQFRSITWFKNLPFKDGVLDYLYSSHLLEDYEEREEILNEWARVLKPGGYLVVLVPDKEMFNKAVANGQNANSNHKREWTIGEGAAWAKSRSDVELVEERITDFRGLEEYNTLVVFKKL